jgi:hypothetical protein
VAPPRFSNTHRKVRRIVLPTIAVVTVVGGLGCFVVGVASAEGSTRRHLFSDSPLAPGVATTGQIEVDPADRTLTPYIKVLDVRDSCLHQCPANAPTLSHVLQVQVRAPDGTGWTKTLEDLTEITALSGGNLSPNSPARTYRVAASLPPNAGNRAEGLSTSFVVQWGLMDSNDHPVTRVLGESFQRDPGNRLQSHELPFTGSDVVLELLASASTVAIGVSLVGAARRRWQ